MLAAGREREYGAGVGGRSAHTRRDARVSHCALRGRRLRHAHRARSRPGPSPQRPGRTATGLDADGRWLHGVGKTRSSSHLDAMACATAATSGTPKTQLDVVFWATMESVVIVVYVSIAFMGIASLLHDAEQAHRWAPQDTLGARRAAQYSNAPNAKKPPVSPL